MRCSVSSPRAVTDETSSPGESCRFEEKIITRVRLSMPKLFGELLTNGSRVNVNALSAMARCVTVSVNNAIDGGPMVSVLMFDVTIGFETVIGTAPVLNKSVYEIVAVSWFGETNVVGRSELFQRTTDVFRKFVPETLSVKPLAPISAVAGWIALIAGTIGVIRNVEGLDVPPGLETVMVAAPGVPISAAEIMVEIWVGVTRVVGRSDPLHRTTVSLPKFSPSTVNMKDPPPAWLDAGERLVIA